MEKMKLDAEVVQRKDDPSAWGVEAIDYNSDGAVYMAVFSGPRARERALEYAREKFSEAREQAA